MNGIDGGVAVVTGAAAGIGRASARRFASEGASVVVADIDADDLAETVDLIEADGGEATAVETDVSDDDDVAALVESTIDTYGVPDFACNNAGIEGSSAPLSDQSLDDYKRVIDVNQTGVWNCLTEELAVMADNGGGAIVNMSSIAGLSAAGGGPYVASKHGVVGLTRVAAAEYGPAGVRVNAVCPGVIDTEMIDRASEEMGEEGIDQIVRAKPLRRMGDPDEVAAAVVWLCSEESSFVTGHPLVVDGGYVA
ncbi:glucose 1-dehydrogenase [Halobaculum gomorrense]|uniref:NAD(P)-dependent dehydrogenase, short-chain alcohol dehydrogenase family n=1 Tax=Halobaculum gomorrense TaxID=43928 RepID=A0A1M5NY94_9EURY|nr:glucose 1-dehydrogenase [Halobaculum gomorrense]SHG94458.1 NAD(P)-dependent dehydrogenase, short-chain alcohol dehydrogenase family [Halobaculum gomorrense]